MPPFSAAKNSQLLIFSSAKINTNISCPTGACEFALHVTTKNIIKLKNYNHFISNTHRNVLICLCLRI
jgi:hypothetical protein